MACSTPHGIRRDPLGGLIDQRWSRLKSIRERRKGRLKDLPPRPAAGDSTMPRVMNSRYTALILPCFFEDVILQVSLTLAAGRARIMRDAGCPGNHLMTDILPVLIMVARPAAGKSEIIQFLNALLAAERRARYHLGGLRVFDDFPMLWAWFEEDDLLEKALGRPRLHTTPDGYFTDVDLWHVLIHRLSLEYDKWRREPHAGSTAVIEFSRGAEHGGYRSALSHLSDTILSQAACCYVKVSYEESLRKNRRRFDPSHPDSILQHSLSDEKMDRLYREDDWDALTADDPEYLHVRGRDVPYVVLDNEDDVTTRAGPELAERLAACLERLWELWMARDRL